MQLTQQAGANFWSRQPFGLHKTWAGSRSNYRLTLNVIAQFIDGKQQGHISLRKIAREVGVHFSSICRFLRKGALLGLWEYTYDKAANRSLIRFVGGVFKNLWNPSRSPSQTQHPIGRSGWAKKKSQGVSKVGGFSNATPTQHLTQHYDEAKRSQSKGLMDRIRQMSILNATPNATQI